MSAREFCSFRKNIDCYRPHQSLAYDYSLFFSFGFIIVQEISTFCALTRFKVIITIKHKLHVNYHFLQGDITAENLIRNPLF